MAWIKSQTRLTQCYVYATAVMNTCGIRPDGAEIKQWIIEELNEIEPAPTKLEIDMVLGLMWKEGVKFHGDHEAQKRFAEHPLFAGHKLGELKCQNSQRSLSNA